MAVGLAVKSYDEMMTSGMRGKGVEILHVYKDQLWLVSTHTHTHTRTHTHTHTHTHTTQHMHRF